MALYRGSLGFHIVAFAGSISSHLLAPYRRFLLALYRRFYLAPYRFFLAPYCCICWHRIVAFPGSVSSFSWLRIIVFLASYRRFLLAPYRDIFLAPYRRFFPAPYRHICWLRIIAIRLFILLSFWPSIITWQCYSYNYIVSGHKNENYGILPVFYLYY